MKFDLVMALAWLGLLGATVIAVWLGLELLIRVIGALT